MAISQALPSAQTPQARRPTELIIVQDPGEERKKPVMKFKTKSHLEASLSPIQAQVSMDDLYVVE